MTRLRIPTPHRATAIDIAVALVATAFAQAAVWSGTIPGRPLPLALLFLPGTVALLWRRTAPHIATILICGAVAVQALATGDTPEGTGELLPALLALYALGAYGTRRQALLAVPVAIAGIALHDVDDKAFANDPWAARFFWIVAATVYVVGLVVGFRRHAVALRRQAVDTEAARESQESAAVADERGRISRELHDAVAHSVSVTVIQAEAAEEVLEHGDPDETRESLQRIQDSGREALTEMRRLLGLLREDGDGGRPAPQPGMRDLDSLAQRIRSAGLEVRLEVRGTPLSLPPGIDISAYRVVQEALTNALKQGAARALVEVAYERAALTLAVVDDGRHAATAAREAGPLSGGQGLAGLRERVSFFGGELRAGPSEDGGFAVNVRLPVPESSAR